MSAAKLSPRIRPPSTPEELHAAVALSRMALEPQWRFDESALTRCMDHALIGVIDGDVLGVAALHDGQKAAVNLVAVRSDARRRGVGTALVEIACHELRQRGHHSIVAAGAGPYLWPGIPRDLPGAVDFFNARGWQFDVDVHDLTRSLLDYETPPDVAQRAREAEIDFGRANERERDHIASLAPDHWYPGWDRHFAGAVPDDVVVGRRRNGDVVAALIVGQPNRSSPWELMLGPGVTTIGCVGTLSTCRSEGIGTALVAHASELLRQSGGTTCHIGWTVLLDFYGRLGYRPWRSYATAATNEA